MVSFTYLAAKQVCLLATDTYPKNANNLGWLGRLMIIFMSYLAVPFLFFFAFSLLFHTAFYVISIIFKSLLYAFSAFVLP